VTSDYVANREGLEGTENESTGRRTHLAFSFRFGLIAGSDEYGESIDVLRNQDHTKRLPTVKPRACQVLHRVRTGSATVSCKRSVAPKWREVTFEAGARSAWHTHPFGQVLIVTEGTGWIQQWGGLLEEIRKGDCIWIPAGVKHWHGASPSTSMTHIAIQENLDGKAVEWMEKVTDEQYRK
jgi:quercetin dioxygenase-like cupin family protein